MFETGRRQNHYQKDKDKMGSKVKSDFLFAQPSLLSGTARLLDFEGLYDEYNISPTEAQADAMAALADWLVTGNDLLEAMQQQEHIKVAA